MVAEKGGGRSSVDRASPGWFPAVLLGLVACAVSALALFLAIAIYDYFACADTTSFTFLALAGTYLATAVGGFVAAKAAGRRGLLCGGLVGVLFATATMAIGAAGGPSSMIVSAGLKKLAFSGIVGGVGGMLGVASS